MVRETYELTTFNGENVQYKKAKTICTASSEEVGEDDEGAADGLRAA